MPKRKDFMKGGIRLVMGTMCKTLTAVSTGIVVLMLVTCKEDVTMQEIDTTPPKITLKKSEVDVSGGREADIGENQLTIGDEAVASWTDDSGKPCKVHLTFKGQDVVSGSSLSDEGTLKMRVEDQSGNAGTAEIRLTVNADHPVVTLVQEEVNVFGGAIVIIGEGHLLIEGDTIALWTGGFSKVKSVGLNFGGKVLKSGETVNEAGTLTLTVTNEKDHASTAEITLTNDAIYGLEVLRKASLQVDQETDLLEGLTFANGVSLVKIELEMDGERYIIPQLYTPDYPGECSIIFTIEKKDNTTSEITIDQLTIKPLEYKAMPITNLKPVDILPIIGQVEKGWGDGYSPIEHLRVAESTRMRDMMWKYGAGKHTPEQYQQLMARLHTGMIKEIPYDYDNYEIVGNFEGWGPSKHAYEEWHILNTLIDHANFQISNNGSDIHDLGEIINNNPYNIYIFGNSNTVKYKPEHYDLVNKEGIGERLSDARNLNNFILRIAGTNIENQNGKIINKICNRDIPPSQEGIRYSDCSRANSKNNNHPQRHIMVTIGTNSEGNVDQTGEDGLVSKFPVGFNDNVLFSGRTFPYRDYQMGAIISEGYKYPTSYTNYVNVAMTDLCFQMFAEVEDVNQLLTMIRSTSLTDYISLDGETQQLQLINPAGFIQKYLMPEDQSTTISWSTTAALDKGYYKGIIYDIPGAEVLIDGEWTPWNAQNKDLIKAQNPFTLEWRLNGDLLHKMGYRSGDTVKGKLLVADDQFNGLNIAKEISVVVSE